MSTLLDLTFGTLSQSCFATEQLRLKAYAEVLKAILPAGSEKVVIQATAPGAEDRDKLWIRDTDGTEWLWIGGKWVWPHPLPPGFITFYDPTLLLSNLDTYDGGSSGVVGQSTGPMWQELTSMRGRFPLHPDGSATHEGDQGGEATHAITIDEMPEHAHPRNPDGKTENVHVGTGGTIVGDYTGGNSYINQYVNTGMAGLSQAMSLMPPYKCVPIIQRTARIFKLP